jgi:isopenicillin-N N-acyltransferase-like protein
MKLFRRITLFFFIMIVALLVVFVVYVKWVLEPKVPQIADRSAELLQRTTVDSTFYKVKNCWLRKSNSGLWEEYIEGQPFERGVIEGKLCKDLQYQQEVAFAEQIHRLVPSNTYLHFLGYFTRIFNRKLEDNIPLEYKQEIYGESLSAPHEFDYIGEPYDRLLNYHAAHDIGHALQSLALVGCTSFSAWDEYTSDSTMLIGRNFDFYVGDKFSENKIVYFCKPTEGNKFAMITWAGFMGCVSGMNDKGITVTINAAKSDIPTASATPISILAREILQYANTIEDAYAIAKKRKTFVSESLMIGSGSEHQTAIIEKSPTKTALYETDKHEILCTNHYQSDSFKNDKNNIANIATSASEYRYERLVELLKKTPRLDYKSVAKILRDQKGKGNKNIGMGNEKAMNQLIAHHSIIFQPEKRRFWISTQPYQLGEYICYDFDSIFVEAPHYNKDVEIYNAAYTISADSFLYSNDWQNFLKYKRSKEQIKEAIKKRSSIENESAFIGQFLRSNPEEWETYYWTGELYRSQHEKGKAVVFYNESLTKEINDSSEVYKIKKLIKECNQ